VKAEIQDAKSASAGAGACEGGWLRIMNEKGMVLMYLLKDKY